MSTACVVAAVALADTLDACVVAIVVEFDATVVETLEAIVVFATVVGAAVVVGAVVAKVKERPFKNGEHIKLIM